MLIKIASIAALGLFAVAVHELPDLKIGDALPAAEVKMKNVDGNMKTLKDLVGPQGLLVMFSCNTCPFVIGSEGSAGWEGRYPEVMAFAARFGVGVAVLNSNEAKRADGERSPAWIDRQRGKVNQGLKAMSDDLGANPWCHGSSLSLADIAIGCALGYVSFRLGDIRWREQYPNLAQLYEKLMQRPAFAETVPQG